jgi:hypothetical protein
MARFRRRKAYRIMARVSSPRSYFRAKKRSRSRSRNTGGGMTSLLKTIAIAGAYGAIRPYAANLVKPVSEQPMVKQVLGNASDEVTLLGGAFLLKKFGKKIPMSNEVSNAILIVEAARIGDMLASNTIQSSGGSAGNQTVYS